MSGEFKARSLAVLGRQPELGVAELERLYGAKHLKPISGAALLDIAADEVNFKRLGGTIKVAKILKILPTQKWTQLEKYLIENIPRHLKNAPEGQFTLGLSAYEMRVGAKEIHRSLMKIKKSVRADSRPIRVVPNKTPALSSAQVLYNKLTSRGAWELLLVASGSETILAQTIFVQDINAYSARDQARPKRDAKVGMLPPKLAQIILNLANPPLGSLVLDPFCGTGVILQEALLTGYKALGTDIDERMVAYSRQNIDWLLEDQPALKKMVSIEQADATKMQWNEEIGGIASELHLGKPLLELPTEEDLKKIISEVSAIAEKFLRNAAGQVKSKTPLCLAVPAWKTPSGEFIKLPIIDHLTDMGYNYLDLKHVQTNDLIYFRENQTVVRQLVILEKS